MAKLNDNGRCAIVVPEGVLFNCTKMYKETRKFLLENFNLKKIIKVGEGEFFKHTGVKTSVLYFEKSGQTESVEFIQVNKVNDSIEEVPLMTVEMEKIIENDYSLNMNLYKEIVLDVNEDFEVFELGEIVNDVKERLNVSDINDDYIKCINIGATQSNSNNYKKYIINKKDYKNNSMNIAREGDILLSSVRPKLNKVIFVKEEILYNSGFIIIRANDYNNAKFLYYLLKNENINRQLIDISESSSSLYPTINFKSIKRIKLPKFRDDKDKVKFIKELDEKERLINHLEKNIIRAENEAKEIMSVLFN